MSFSDKTTSLVILIPEKFQPRINEVRQELSKAYPRWPAHIKLLFPFGPQEEFPHYLAQLGPILADLPKINIRLSEISVKGEKGEEIRIYPDDESLEGLQLLYKVLNNNLPKTEDTPRLWISLGRCELAEKDKILASLQEWWGDGIEFQVDQIQLLARSKEDSKIPMTVKAEISLGNHFPGL